MSRKMPTKKDKRGAHVDTKKLRESNTRDKYKGHRIGDGEPGYKANLFLHEWIKDCDATKAAIRAGYSHDTAAQVGCMLLKKFKNKAEDLLEEKLYKLDLSAERIIEEMGKMALVNMKDLYDENGQFIPISDLPRYVAAAISSIETERQVRGKGEDAEVYEIKKIKLHDKKAASEVMMKYHGLLTDKKVISNPDGTPIIPPTSTVKYIFDPSSLSDKELNALLVLIGDEDPIEKMEDET